MEGPIVAGEYVDERGARVRVWPEDGRWKFFQRRAVGGAVCVSFGVLRRARWEELRPARGSGPTPSAPPSPPR